MKYGISSYKSLPKVLAGLISCTISYQDNPLRHLRLEIGEQVSQAIQGSACKLFHTVQSFQVGDDSSSPPSLSELKSALSLCQLPATDPLSKQDFKPSKQNHARCSQPWKKRKDSLPPLACTQQAYGEKESFAWTGNFLKMLHTSKKSYFIQQVVIKWNKKNFFCLDGGSVVLLVELFAVLFAARNLLL